MALWGSPLRGDYNISSPFGIRNTSIAGASKNHAGIDYAAPYGTPVYATGAGTISYAGVAGGYGNLIKLDMGGGYESRYGHLSNFAQGISSGAAVSQGELIGYVGSTGVSSGNHLHYEERFNGTAYNPSGEKLSAIGTVPTARSILGAAWDLATGMTLRPTAQIIEKSSDILGGWISRITVIIVGLILLAIAGYMLASKGNREIVIQKVKGYVS